MVTTARKLHWKKPDVPDAMCGRNGSTVTFADYPQEVTCGTCVRRMRETNQFGPDAPMSELTNADVFSGVIANIRDLNAGKRVRVKVRRRRNRDLRRTSKQHARAEKHAIGTRKYQKEHTKSRNSRHMPGNIFYQLSGR